MSTGDRKVNIFLKKFLTQQHITDNFLDYLHELIMEDHQKLVPSSGVYSYPVTAKSTLVDTIDFLTPGEINAGDGNGPQLEADDGHGRILKLDDLLRQQVLVPNDVGVKYYSGVRFNYYPVDTEINVRTGIIKWSLYNEAIGERGEPNFVSYYGSQLQMQVDNICKDVNQHGRVVRVWLKTPVSQASGDVYEEVSIIPQSIVFGHDGGLNYFDVPNEMSGYFAAAQSVTIDQVPTNPVTTTVTFVGADDSGGSGYTRITVPIDLSVYTVATSSFVLSGNNVINLVGTLGQSSNPSIDPTDYEIFLYGITITTQDLRLDEYYAYLLNYTGTGTGNNPGSFDFSDQVEVPNNFSSISIILSNFKKYQIQRNAFILRGGGQFKFESGTLDWNQEFQIVNPFRGLYSIAASSLGGIVNDDILYTKIYIDQPVVIDGNASGEIWIEDTTDFSDNDAVIIGDNDSNRVTGYIMGAPGLEKIVVDDGLGTPLDLSGFTTLKGAWVQRTNISLQKAQINEGDLRPAIFGELDEDVAVIAVAHNNVLVFKDGVLRLEDGDVGEISNLPSGFTWVNNITELTDSITKTQDKGIGVLSPGTYTPTVQIDYNKNLAWIGLSDWTIIQGNLATPVMKIQYDATTTDSYMRVELNRLIIQNNGAGDVIEIDNTGATKGMEIVLDGCVLLGSGGNVLKVTHSESSQWIKVRILNSRSQDFEGSIVFESQNNSDELFIKNVKLAAGETITFGKAAFDPTSTCTIHDCWVDHVDAVGAGTNKSINIINSYSYEDNKRIDLNGSGNATFNVNVDLVDLQDFINYQTRVNGLIFRGGGQIDFLSSTFSWTADFEIFDPFYGISIIPAGSIPAIVNNDVFYTKLYRPQEVVVDGNPVGQIGVKDTSDFNDNDTVVVGDANSTQLTGYVMGVPAGGIITVDDGAGNPYDLSNFTKSQGAWIQRTNIAMLKGTQNVGDLRPDYLRKTDSRIYVIAVCNGNNIVDRNGEIYTRQWVYEEPLIVTSPVDIDDAITLPVDSRNGNAVKYYRNGTGDLQMFVNGNRWFTEQVLVVSSFTPTFYDVGTGVVTVPDAVDLSNVRREDLFYDALGAEFTIFGNIDNTLGNKQFRIASGQVVNLGAGAYIVRQDYAETGVAEQFVTTIQAKRRIPINAIVAFRIMPFGTSGGGGGGGGGGGTLQDAYVAGSTMTIAVGNPVIVNGPGGQKLFQFNGDIGVTGIIDPEGLEFASQVTNPDPSKNLVYFKNTGELIFNNLVSGLEEVINAESTAVKEYTNNQGSPISKGRVVRKSAIGFINYADWTADVNSRAIGISMDNINDGSDGLVKKFGYIEQGVITADDFTEAMLPADGARIWLADADGKMTVTPPTTGSGNWEVYMGIWDDGGLNLQIALIGQA